MDETKVITGLVRFSYVNAFEPRAAKEGEKKKYSVAILVPKSSKKMVKQIEDAIDAACELGSAKFKNKNPKKIAKFWWPLRDGDDERDEDPVYEGMYFLNAKSDNKPAIVDVDREEILDKEDFYSGCWGRASINFYAYNQEGGIGIACGLNNLQKLKDDDRLGGGSSAAEDFAEDWEGDELLG